MGERGTPGRKGVQDGGGSQPSVFAPGYEGQRPTGTDRHSAAARASAPWYGSTASGAAGKGPVRGYPPLPGQPPPLYPPGPFAAWNRGARQAGHAASPPPGSQLDPSGWHARPSPPSPSGAGYYGHEAEPGYSQLAVSDPAADVTTTQTWRAVADGRATGTWVMPDRAGLPDRTPGAVRPGLGQTAPAPAEPDRGAARPAPDSSGPGRRAVPGSTQAAPRLPAGASRLAGSADAESIAPAKGGLGAPAQPASGPVAAATAAREPAARAPGQARPPRGPESGQATRRKSRGRRYPRSAYAVALVLVLAAGVALYYAARLVYEPSHPSAASQSGRTATPTPSSTPTLGRYGHIASRQGDPQPLTIAQLYPLSFTATGSTFSRTAERLTGDCTGAVVGSGLQAAVGSAGCTQAARATYLSGTMMGTIGALNLKTATVASKAARAAGASDFIAQLPGRTGATRKLGHGTGMEEAFAKGHYLILIWAEFTDLRAPSTSAQRASLEGFMTQILQNTANVSLSSRMANGTPG